MPRQLISLLLAVGLAGTGCGYTSTYVAPPDGRARVVWRDGSAVALVPPQDQACWQEVQRVSGTSPPLVPGAPPVAVAAHTHGPYFHLPVYVHVHHHHVAGPHHAAAHRAVSAGADGVHKAVPAGAPSAPKSPSPSVNSGDADFHLLAVAATVAIVAMPFVALALALDEPERPVQSAAAIDVVNAYNDLSRAPGTACSIASEVTP